VIGFDELWTGYLWPLIIMVAQSVLLLVVLLIAIAYVLLADRKIWAAVQIRRGPNVVGPWGLLHWYFLPLFPMFVIFFVSALAETNRPPFDLVEAESELVAGFMVEYGSTPYLLFMLGEYVAIVTMCALATILFLGGWLPPVDLPPFNWVPGIIWFSLKVFFMFFLFAMAKAIVPRYRYDQLMRLGWKVFLPLSLAMVIVVAGVLHFAGIAPK
jgi:NADH-quinone oxidoreductase subunit H